MGPRPVKNLGKWLPKRLLLQMGMSHVGPADNQAIQSLAANLVKGLIKAINMGLGLGAAW